MADLIERDALIDYMKQIYCERIESSREKCSACVKGRWRGVECSACWVNDCIDDIENAPAVNRWIPCSERLPEPNETVLYVWRSKNGNVSVLHGWHFENRVENAWHQSGIGMSRPNEEVTHWMPLPEPPESDAQE